MPVKIQKIIREFLYHAITRESSFIVLGLKRFKLINETKEKIKNKQKGSRVTFVYVKKMTLL